MDAFHVNCVHCRIVLIKMVDAFWQGKTQLVICADCARPASASVGSKPSRNPNVSRIHLFED